MPDPRVAVGIITRNRRDGLLAVLEHLTALPEEPRVVVVDNGSTDGTPAAVRRCFPTVEVLALPANLGAAGRNLAVRAAGTPYVAFADDDSWWAPGALRAAADTFDRHARLALLQGRILVGADERLDPACAAMAASPLPPTPAGPRLLGFVACGAVVRASAFLDAGGFAAPLGVGGEETLLALDVAGAGWELAYVPAVVAHHHPSPVRDPAGRRRRQAGNAALTALQRHAHPGRAVLRALADPRGWPVLAGGAVWALARRRPSSPSVLEGLVQLDG